MICRLFSYYKNAFSLAVRCQTIHAKTETFLSYRDSVTRFFASGFFYESVSPQPQSITIGPFRIFSKIRGDIRKSRCTTGVNDTGGKFATGINDTGGIKLMIRIRITLMII